MQVGGLAMHWGGVTPRFSPEDFRTKSLFGVGTDWPISYDDLDPFYQEAEELMGVAGEQGPRTMDPRSKPFPMPALPLTYNLRPAEGLGVEGRHRDVESAVGEELHAVWRSSAVLSQRHLLADLSDRREVFAGLHVAKLRETNRIRCIRARSFGASCSTPRRNAS